MAHLQRGLGEGDCLSWAQWGSRELKQSLHPPPCPPTLCARGRHHHPASPRLCPPTLTACGRRHHPASPRTPWEGRRSDGGGRCRIILTTLLR